MALSVYRSEVPGQLVRPEPDSRRHFIG